MAGPSQAMKKLKVEAPVKSRAGASQPLADTDLDAIFSIFPPRGRIVLAVSGGADSTALLWLASRWKKLRAPNADLVAATVDHGLRPSSAGEAKAVAVLAAKLKIPHHTLNWRGAKPNTGIEAAARAARYDLLFGFALSQDATHVATAHTLDDQAETVLMRLAAGSGPAGLAGMRARDQRGGVTLVRPLLKTRKARLVATLEAAGVRWSEDAMNRDMAFARPRLRQVAAVLAAEGLTPERLGRLAERMQRYEAAVESLVVNPVHALPGVLDGRALAAGPEEIAIRQLGRAIRAAGPLPPHVPRLEQVEVLWAALRAAIGVGARLRRTLGGALVAADPQGAIRVSAAPERRTAKSAEKHGKTAGLLKQIHQD